MRVRGLVSTAAVALMLAAPAFAQQPQAAGQNPSAVPNTGQEKPSRADFNFMKQAAIGGMAEVELGKLAQQNGQDPQVKQFGAKMEQDHSQANQQLEQLATEQGVQLPKQLDPKHQQDMDRLSRLRGPGFDKAYMRMMVEDHNKDLKEFQHQAQTTKDSPLQQFTQQGVQMIEQHDQLAKQIDRSPTATGSSRERR